MIVTGKIVDEQNGQPIPRATVSLLSGNVNLISGAADDNGNFSITTNQTPDNILITSIGYQGTYWPLPQYQNTAIFDLKVSSDPLDTIIVEYKPKKDYAWLFILITIGIFLSKNKKYKYAYTRRRAL